ncbi:MAG TPA: hypothetical protein VIJ14_00085, partial [Rhabdochlamydiaceae bacterium]
MSSPDLRSAAKVVSAESAPRARLQRAASFSDVTVLNTKALSPEFTAEIAKVQAAKEQAAAKEAAFEKAKASTSYGISTIHYGLILPLKNMIVGLTDEQATKLDLYTKHTALCKGIKSVQKAFKTFISAQEAADKAPTNPATAREGARRTAMTAGDALVENYENLIQLAIGQADAIDADRTEFLEDLHGELEENTWGLILKTVDMIRPRQQIETGKAGQAGLLDQKDYLRSELSDRYKSFVTDFVSNVQESRRQSGDSSALYAITDAFIQGLAAIPELGELDHGLILIELYDELTAKQDPKHPGVGMEQNEAIRHFEGQIEALILGTDPVTTEDLQDIQYKGISLTSVMPSINVEQLNELRELSIQLEEVQAQIQVAQAEL